MNRFEQEAARKRAAERDALIARGLTPQEADAEQVRLDRRELAAEWLRQRLFPEEYDYMFDTSLDLRERRRGINPMKPEYVEKMNAKREALGVPALDPWIDANRATTLAWCRPIVDTLAEILTGIHTPTTEDYSALTRDPVPNLPPAGHGSLSAIEQERERTGDSGGPASARDVRPKQ